MKNIINTLIFHKRTNVYEIFDISNSSKNIYEEYLEKVKYFVFTKNISINTH